MRRRRTTAPFLALVFLIGIAAGTAFFLLRPHPSGTVDGRTVTVYYTRSDGQTLAPMRVTLGPARDPKSVAFYAAVQCVAGPSADVEAVRFPPGTRVLGVDVAGSTAVVDLSPEIDAAAQGGFTEAALFKALTYTLTALPGIDAVTVHVAGAPLATLPGGHLELDEPLTRSSFG